MRETVTSACRPSNALRSSSAAWIPWPEHHAFRPFASVYLWRRPDENQFFRGTLVGLSTLAVGYVALGVHLHDAVATLFFLVISSVAFAALGPQDADARFWRLHPPTGDELAELVAGGLF